MSEHDMPADGPVEPQEDVLPPRVSEDQEGSGDGRVDEAIAGLDAAADLPPSEQVAAYESAHRVLQDTLATIDEA
ncbi:MAG: hypothetical protein GEU94_21595 [Micromonosporaceae bacterium]|nr:hypothetical protein [Micromonosporaceae bacterium]